MEITYVCQILVDHSSSYAWVHFPIAIPMYFQWGWLQNPSELIHNPMVHENRSARIRTSSTPIISQFRISLKFLGLLPNLSIGFANTNDINELKQCECSPQVQASQHLWLQIRLMNPTELHLPRDSKVYLNGCRASRSQGTRVPMALVGSIGNATFLELTLTRLGDAMYLHLGDVFLRSIRLLPLYSRLFAQDVCAYAVLAIDEDYGYEYMSADVLASRLQ